MSDLPLISVVTPTLDCGVYLRDCIESVLAQKYENFEHVVVDGVSKDDTVEILKQYPHVRWISEPDRGEGEALNKAIAMVSGDIIYWLNADDYVLPGVFHRVSAAFQARSEPCVFYGDVEIVDTQGELLIHQKSSPNADLSVIIRWWRNLLHPHQPALFYSSEAMRQLGKFRDELHFALDHEYVLRAVVRFPFVYLGIPVAGQRLREESKSWEAGRAVSDVHRTVSLPYVRHLGAWQKACFWMDYGVQYLVPIPAELKIKLGLRTRLRRLLGSSKG